MNFSFCQIKLVRNRFHKTVEFKDILPRLTQEREANRWKIEENGYLHDWLLPWQQSATHSWARKRNPRYVVNLHCECQELKPKDETNSSFLVLHPSSGVDAVNTVGSHLNARALITREIMRGRDAQWKTGEWPLSLENLGQIHCFQLIAITTER